MACCWLSVIAFWTAKLETIGMNTEKKTLLLRHLEFDILDEGP